MADSNITKLALSNALKELLEEQAFEKISVADICDRCGMNRKSFYYHFRDKYDLVNWIFDTEFVELIQVHPEKLRAMVKATGAVNTDYQSPESVDHLCDKTIPYAENWKPTADKLWSESCAKCRNCK